MTWISVIQHSIIRVCERNKLPKEIADLAYSIAHDYLEEQERKEIGIELAVVYLACKEKGIKTTLEEIEEKTFPLDPDLNQEFLLKKKMKRLEKSRTVIKKITKQAKEKPFLTTRGTNIRFGMNIMAVCERNKLPKEIAELADTMGSKCLGYYEVVSIGSAIGLVYLACKEKGIKTTLETIEEKTFPLDPELNQEFLLNKKNERLKQAKIIVKKMKEKISLDKK